MSPETFDPGPELVAELVRRQFPRWADLPLSRFPSDGTDNAIYRLGADLVIRAPKVARAAGHPAKEHRWLGALAAESPLTIAAPLALGEPDVGYPWSWSISPWIPGDPITTDRPGALSEAAGLLAEFLSALQAKDASAGPPAGPQNEYRGVALAMRDGPTRAAIAALDTDIPANLAREVWEAALATDPWSAAPVWVHGDLHAGNLLARDGRLSAVIDFGLLGVGDPACDLMIAWSMLDGPAREVFRDRLAIDPAGWIRGRGWALSVALVALAYYRDSHPALARASRRTIDAVLAEVQAAPP